MKLLLGELSIAVAWAIGTPALARDIADLWAGLAADVQQQAADTQSPSAAKAAAVDPLIRDDSASENKSGASKGGGGNKEATAGNGEKNQKGNGDDKAEGENKDKEKEKAKDKEEKKDEKDEDKDKKQEKEANGEDERFGPNGFTDRNGLEWYHCFGQVTVISQSNGPFRSPYEGPHSFRSENDTAVSETSTVFIGARMGQLGQLYFDPEIAGGRGLSDVFGLGVFPNGDITRVGLPQPTPYVARLYVQQDYALGSEMEKVESAVHQLGGCRPVSRLTLAVGKIAATDWFDVNRYSHDPRTQFMNWGLMYNGAWDYAADVRGYTWGGVAEWNEEKFALRYGLFAEPQVANGSELDPNFGRAHEQAVELELRYLWNCRPGKIRGMVYVNQAFMGNYREALTLSPVNPDITRTRSYTNVKYGYLLNLEQEFSDDLGGFMRLGWNDGTTETWAFTEIDQTICAGIVLRGTAWHRPQDECGAGVVLDGLSGPHRDYLAVGGLGFELGDGRLSYGPESAIEIYYRWRLSKYVTLTPDFQLIQNPGYNTDRGPIFIAGARAHADF